LAQSTSEELVDGEFLFFSVRENDLPLNSLSANAFRRRSTRIGDQNDMWNPTRTGQRHAACDVDCGIRVIWRITEQPIFVPLQIDAVSRKVDYELARIGSIDQCLDQSSDIGDVDRSLRVGQKMDWIHPLHQCPRLHELCASRCIIELWQIPGLVDAYDDCRAFHRSPS
jgi:hypothetical protein